MKHWVQIAASVVVALLPLTVHADFRQWLVEHAREGVRIDLGTREETALSEYLGQNSLESQGTQFSEMRPPSHAGWHSGSLEFSGSESYLIARTIKEAPFFEEVSVGFWIKPDFTMFEASRQSRFIVSKSASVEAGFFVSVTAQKGISVGLVTNAGFHSLNVPGVLENYRWHHVGFTWNGSELQLYVDGKKQGEPKAATGTYHDYKAGYLTFGRAASLPVNFYKGLISDFILVPQAYQP